MIEFMYVANALFTAVVLEFAYEKKTVFLPGIFYCLFWPITWIWLMFEWADKRLAGRFK